MDGCEMRFLVVDDDVTIRDLLTTILNHLGYQEVSLASTAQEALSLVERSTKPFQCILLDIQMPGMDGVELCHILRQKRGYRDVPIVMLTAMSERHYLDQAFRNGATDYIQKPFEVTDLGVRIGVAIKLAATQAEVRRSRARQQQTNKLAGNGPVRFEEALPLDAPNATDYLTFENYVLALPLRLTLSTYAFGVGVAGLKEIHAKVSGDEFRKLIDIAGASIAAAQKKTGPLYTYSGSGVFVMLQMRGEPFYLKKLLQNFSEAVVEHSESVVGRALADKLHIQIGEAVRLWSLRRDDRIISVRKAASNVFCAKDGISVAAHQTSRKSEYKSLLKEFEHDAGDLSSLVRHGQKIKKQRPTVSQEGSTPNRLLK